MASKTLVDYSVFLTTVFDENDFVWITDAVTEECFSIPLEHATDWFQKHASNGVYMAINGAIDAKLPRKKHNVMKKRSFLIEFDDMPLKKQVEYVENLGMPWTTCTYSAGKSLHYLITLDEPMDDVSYSTLFSMIVAQSEYVDKDGKVRYHIDPANKDVCRFSRLPMAVRNGKEQKLCQVKSRVNRIDLLAWLDEPKQRTKWESSHLFKTIEKKNKPTEKTKDRAPFVELLKWYLDWHVGTKYNGNVFVQCPVCATNGGDKAGDNLHITGDNMLTHCFAHPDEHNPLIFKEISKLKQEVIAENLIQETT